MSAATGPPSSGDRVNKRLKHDANGPPPDGGYHPGYGQMPPQGRYQGHPPYGGPSSGHPMQHPPSGYGMWQQNSQYGSQPPPPPPPHSWQHGQPPPHGMYSRGAPPPPHGDSSWSGYRGPPPPQPPPPPMGPSGGRRSAKGSTPSRSTSTAEAGPSGPPPDGPQHYQNWGQQQQQWSGNPGPWQGGPPPPMWQGGPPPQPPMHQPPMYGGQKMWSSGSATPPRSAGGRPRGSPDMGGMMGGYGQPGGQPLCMDTAPEMEMYVSSRHDDDGKSGSSKDKGRGSYKCGRCGVPKKGHICPYQPKVKRRPGEPAPELRNAAVQVEVDEFMTLRRLNLKIQGFPESYATEPYMSDDMVGAEPHSLAPPGSTPPAAVPRGGILAVDDMGHLSGPPPDQAESGSIHGSPRASPRIQDDPEDSLAKA